MLSDELLITPRAPRALAAGVRLRAGQVIDWAGGGSTGHVYRVVDEMGAQIAVREYFPPEIARREGAQVLAQDGCEAAFQEGLKLFEEDGWQLAAQDHPGLLKALQVWSEHGTVYLSMPWCEGHTLAAIVRAAPMPPSQAQLCNWLRAMADALTLVHRRRGLHGNVAPGQVMQLDSGRLLLMEFARARRFVTRDPREVERDPFAALECGTDPRCGPTGPWTDVYALAATLYFVLRGRAPQSAARRAAFDAQEPLTTLAGKDYSETFLRGIDEGLAVKPRARPQSLPDFLAGLGLRERRARQRATGESLLINLPVADPMVVDVGSPESAPLHAQDDGVPAEVARAEEVEEVEDVEDVEDAPAQDSAPPVLAEVVEEAVEAGPAPADAAVEEAAAAAVAEPPPSIEADEPMAAAFVAAESVLAEAVPLASTAPERAASDPVPPDPRDDWPTLDARPDQPPAKTHDSVPWRGEPVPEAAAAPAPAVWPESAWPVSEFEASAAAATYARVTQRARPPRTRAFAAVAGAGALAVLFGVWLLQVQGLQEPVPMAQTAPPARPPQAEVPAAAPAEPPAAVATTERGASWPIPDPLEPTAAGPTASPPVTTESNEPTMPSEPLATNEPATPPVEAVLPPAVPDAARAGEPPPATPPVRAAKPRAAPAAPAAAPRIAEPATPSPADDAAAASPASRCPELLARQYTGRPLDPAEREQLQARCR